MKRLVLMAVVLVSVLAGCGPGGSGESAAVTNTEHKPTVSMPGDPSLSVGDEATSTETGNTLTVLSYESPVVPAGSPEPRAGFEFSAIEVEGCAGASSGRDLMSISPNAFTLRLSDGTHVRPGVSGDKDPDAKQPALMTMNPPPGECEHGFITYQTPQGERPDLVVFEDPFTTETPAIAWKVPSHP